MRLGLRGKGLLSRINSISLPIGGVSWVPPVDHQDKARRLLVYLEDRRALYHSHDREISGHVIASVLQIRERITSDLEDVELTSPIGESLRAMGAACRKFLDDTGHNGRFEPELMRSLGELRALFGVQIARLACAYDLEVEGELIAILPPVVADQGDE